MQKSLFFFLLSSFFLTTNANNSFGNTIVDTLIPKKENQLQNDIQYQSDDSMFFDITNQKIFLFGNASIKYESIHIQADYIEINWRIHEIVAQGKLDSLGKLQGIPQFTEGADQFTANEIRYNYETKKCIVKNISTQEGEGYILGKTVKKTNDDIFYLKNGDYTTCNAQKPHFSIRANKIKLIPGKKIISGPAHLRIFNFPTPLFLPFGFFPNTSKESSGILVPSYGESQNLGFFLKDGGYYFTISPKIDLSLRADIYSKGSWATRSLLRYKNRYRYSGEFNLSYATMINSEKDMPDYNAKKDFFFRWNHRQDEKANPSVVFFANVNAGSSTYHKNNSFNTNDYLSNTFQSSINWSKKFENSPFHLSANLRHSQNTVSRMVNLTLPDINLSMNRIFPLKNIGKKAKNNWYDNIGFTYTMNTRNELSTLDTLLFSDTRFSDFRNGIKHSIPISTSIKVLKYFSLSPQINFNERWYFSQIEKHWTGNEIITDTLAKFTRAHDYDFSAGLSTKLYGVAQFRKGKIAAFRHVLTPNIRFAYHPDFGTEVYGYYKTVQADTTGNFQTYSIMQNGIFGSPSTNKNGNINFSLGNLLDMKIRSKKDTSEVIKKIVLLQSLSIQSAYNIFADSLPFSMIGLNARTKLFDILDVSFSSQYDPYQFVNGKRIQRMELENNRLARFTNANATFGLSVSNNTFNEKTQETKETKEKEEKNVNVFNPWNLTANYAITYNKNNLPSSEIKPTQSLNFGGNLNVTKKWKIGIHSGYDFQEEEFTYTSVDLYRDLHCWEMFVNWIPIGFHKSYTITIRVKASVLQDLKLEKRKDWLDVDY